MKFNYKNQNDYNNFYDQQKKKDFRAIKIENFEIKNKNKIKYKNKYNWIKK